MASIGKASVAAAHVSQETAFALNHIVLDFAVFKFAAPVEYQGLGSSLSKKRRRNAEGSSMHNTAQKLGALFADDLPNVPSLTKAYGLRVSEIAENPKANPQQRSSYGAFAEFAGFDGTSIWAAATSRKGAMAAHLLACLLSRIWTAAEANAIWCELISERKRILQERIQDDTYDQFTLNAMTAANIDIPRDKIAEWDASARSVSLHFPLSFDEVLRRVSSRRNSRRGD